MSETNNRRSARRNRVLLRARNRIRRSAAHKGEIRKRGQGFVAYDRRGRPLGIFHSPLVAARAISEAVGHGDRS
jgi:hypothetical protein